MAAEPSFRALLFSKTTGFRHDSIPDGIAAIEKLGQEHNFTVDATEDAGAFTDDNLAKYQVVIFLSTTGDPLGEQSQKDAFQRYIEHGAGSSGSTRRPTRATPGRGTASWWARTSRPTRRSSRPR